VMEGGGEGGAQEAKAPNTTTTSTSTV
jgi:hypothetical protein